MALPLWRHLSQAQFWETAGEPISAHCPWVLEALGLGVDAGQGTGQSLGQRSSQLDNPKFSSHVFLGGHSFLVWSVFML